MKYYTISGWWILPFPIALNLVGISLLIVNGLSGGIVNIVLTILFLVINNVFAYFAIKYLYSKEPTLELKETQLVYRGIYKRFTLDYIEIVKLVMMHENTTSMKDKHMTRIKVYTSQRRKPFYIITRLIKGSNTEICSQIESRITQNKEA